MKLKLYSINKSYSGNGINHEKQSFNSMLSIIPVVGAKGAQLTFSAIGIDGTIFHEETSLIGPDFEGKPCLLF